MMRNHGEISMSDSSFCVFKPAHRWSDLLQRSGGSAHDAPRLPHRLSQRLHLRWRAREKAGQAHTLVTAPLIHARGGRLTGCLLTQEAVWRDGPADGRRDRPGRLLDDPSVPRVAGLRLPGLEERLAGHSGIRGNGVCFRQAAQLHLHEGADICLWIENSSWPTLTAVCPSRFTATTCSSAA